MPDDFSVPIEYLRQIAAQLRDLGVDQEAWLRGSGMTPAELELPERPLPFALFRALVLGALDAAREPALGLFVGERLVASTHGMVGAVIVNSRTVRQALEMIQRFASLRTSLFAISHSANVRGVKVVFTPAFSLGEIGRPVLEAVVLSIKNAFDEMTMGARLVEAVEFPFAEPEYGDLARDIFGCSVRYGQPCAAFFGRPELLDVSLEHADPTTFEVAAEICQRQLDQLSESQTVSTQVRRLLLQRQNGFPSLLVVARRLHMTPRTLHRRLVAEGTSYRELLESIRHTLATEHLLSGRFGMDEIAYRLGYTDLSNFRRAFKRWEGVPPSVYRGQS